MASLMEELLLTMDGETEQYEKLISLNGEKKDSIIHKKLDVLEAITVQVLLRLWAMMVRRLPFHG